MAIEEVEVVMIVGIMEDIVVVVVEVTTGTEDHRHPTTGVTITDEDQDLDLILHVSYNLGCIFVNVIIHERHIIPSQLLLHTHWVVRCRCTSGSVKRMEPKL